MESVYELYQRGCQLLDHGDHEAATVPLQKARDLEPEKASIRETLGRALLVLRARNLNAEVDDGEKVLHALQRMGVRLR